MGEKGIETPGAGAGTGITGTPIHTGMLGSAMDAARTIGGGTQTLAGAAIAGATGGAGSGVSGAVSGLGSMGSATTGPIKPPPG